MKIRIEKTKDPIYQEKRKINQDDIKLVFSEEKENNNGHGKKIIELFDENKNPVGNIGFNYPENDLSRMIQIKFVGVDPNFHRRDISVLLYKHLIELAKTKGFAGIRSDNAVQGGALASWKKLADEGYNVTVNPTIEDKYKNFVIAYNEGKIFKEAHLSVARNESVFKINLANK